jgi:hypothetical protein
MNSTGIWLISSLVINDQTDYPVKASNIFSYNKFERSGSMAVDSLVCHAMELCPTGVDESTVP